MAPQFMSLAIIILMTARSKSDSVTAWKFWDGNKKARRGFERYLRSLNVTGRISSRWLGAEGGRLLLSCPEREASPTGGDVGDASRGPRWGLWSSLSLAALGCCSLRASFCCCSSSLRCFPAEVQRPGGPGPHDAPHPAITSSNSIAPGSSPRRAA